MAGSVSGELSRRSAKAKSQSRDELGRFKASPTSGLKSLGNSAKQASGSLRDLKRASREASTALRTLGKGGYTASQQMRYFGRQMQDVGLQVLAVSGVMVGGFYKAIRVASRAQETINKFGAVFGDQTDAANQFVDGMAAAVGRAPNELRDTMASFQAMFVGLEFPADKAREMSQAITALSVDFASFYNLSDEEASQRFISALSGSSEVVDKFGINLKVAALNQELLAMGISGGTLKATEQEKTLARLNIIMRAMGQQGAVGDAVKTAGSFENQLKALTAEITKTANTIGNALLPAATVVVRNLRSAAHWVQEFANANPALIQTVAATSASFAALGTSLVFVGGAMKLAALGSIPLSGLKRVGAAAGWLTGKLGKLGGTIKKRLGREVFSIGSTASLNAIDKIGMAFKRVFGVEIFKSGARIANLSFGKILAAATVAAGAINYAFGNTTAIQDGFGALAQHASVVFQSMAQSAGSAFGDVSDIWHIAYGGIVQSVLSGDIESALAVSGAALNATWTAITANFAGHWFGVVKYVKSLWSSAVSAFASIWQGTATVIASVSQSMADSFSTFFKWLFDTNGNAGKAVAFTWADVTSSVAGMMTSAMASIESAIARMSSALETLAERAKQTRNQIASGIGREIENFGNQMEFISATNTGLLQMAFQGGETPENRERRHAARAKVEAVDKAFDDAEQQARKDHAARIEQIQREHADRLAEIEKQKNDQLAAIDQMREFDNEQNEQERQRAIQEAEQKAAAAKQALIDKLKAAEEKQAQLPKMPDLKTQGGTEKKGQTDETEATTFQSAFLASRQAGMFGIMGKTKAEKDQERIRGEIKKTEDATKSLQATFDKLAFPKGTDDILGQAKKYINTLDNDLRIPELRRRVNVVDSRALPSSVTDPARMSGKGTMKVQGIDSLITAVKGVKTAVEESTLRF